MLIRILAIPVVGWVTLNAQAPLQFGTFYACPNGMRFKIYSCAGTAPDSACDSQVFMGARGGRRGPSPRSQVMDLLKVCRPQTGTAQQSAPAAAQGNADGIRVGDEVEVLTGFGWTPAKVLAINGDSYRVLTNGVQVTKQYPNELRRSGRATAQDHANGQYRLGDRVQVNVGGRWIDSKIVTEMGMDYQVELPGNRTAWVSGKDLRPVPTAPAAASKPKSSTPPKPGMVSCAGKIEGRYVTTGQGSATIIFRSGKATMGNGFGGEDTLECWTGGDKIILREPGHPGSEMPLDINSDGTLQMPIYGEFKKKGN